MEWQPIETAPKDGKRVDLFGLFHNKPVRITNAAWLPHDLYGGPLCDEMWCWPTMDDSERGYYKFTHWMPLPEPPKDVK